MKTLPKKASPATKIKNLEEKVANLEAGVLGIHDKLDKLLTPKETKRVLPTPTIPAPPTPPTPPIPPSTPAPEKPKEPEYPVPLEYREIIDTVLNHSFGLKVVPQTDRPAFELIIVVPEKYSNMDENAKKSQRVDIRSKVISYADGLNGVRQYAELVATNLGPEIRAQIITDRANLQ